MFNKTKAKVVHGSKGKQKICCLLPICRWYPATSQEFGFQYTYQLLGWGRRQNVGETVPGLLRGGQSTAVLPAPLQPPRSSTARWVMLWGKESLSARPNSPLYSQFWCSEVYEGCQHWVPVIKRGTRRSYTKVEDFKHLVRFWERSFQTWWSFSVLFLDFTVKLVKKTSVLMFFF